ncbi:MAG: hypothetical protein R2751_16520, partial [Bacteroidales bacterium]
MAFLLLLAPSVLAQGEIDEDIRLMFRDESTYAISLNSNGFGLNYRYGFWRDARNQFLLEGEFGYAKHPKETKVLGNYAYSTRRYVFGKENLFWDLKAMAGWQKELYRKIDRTGISVRWYSSGGLSLGFIKPIYYEVYELNTSDQTYTTDYSKFDLTVHQDYIAGRGPFFMGFDELRLLPGLTGKTGLSFEYSERDQV